MFQRFSIKPTPRYIDVQKDKYSRYLDGRNWENVESSIPADLNQMTHGSYGGLLFDKRWREKRVKILERDFHKCRICQTNLDLQVHHRQYHYLITLKRFKNPWEYDDNLLITLCQPCHKKGHSKYIVPIINY